MNTANQEVTFEKHECSGIHSIMQYTDKYVMDYCGICGKITALRWHSFWKRLISLI